MRKIVYPGSFDPITLGHFDLIARAAAMTDELVVAVLQNQTKKSFFTVEERVEMLKTCTQNFPNISIDSSDGLLVDYIHSQNAKIILRGLRAVSDFEYELQYAMLNQKLDKEIEAIYLMTSSEYSFLSSSMVREIGALGGDISGMVPPEIYDFVKKRLMQRNK